ncbi:MAG: hypothetical protein ACRC8P_01275 [Spiroplasma sp.]
MILTGMSGWWYLNLAKHSKVVGFSLAIQFIWLTSQFLWPIV